jgi:hypothetical protein
VSRWDEEAFARALRIHAAKRLASAAVKLVAAHQKNLSVANPAPHATPAPKGSFPRGRTFFLRANVGFLPTSLSEIADTEGVTVGIFEPAGYGAILTRRGWLGLGDTYSRSRSEILRSLRGGS